MKKFAPLAAAVLLAGYSAAGQARSSALSKAETPVTPTVEPSIAQQGHEERRGNVAAVTQPSASLFRSGASGFFRDQRASRVGDIVTIKINISDSATVGNSTTRTRDGSDKSGVTSLFGLQKLLPPSLDPGSLVGTNSGSKTSGTGNIARSEKVDMTVAAIVSNVLPNGNLMIRGSQEVRVNSELRELTVTGIVRPEDIARDNSILLPRSVSTTLRCFSFKILGLRKCLTWGRRANCGWWAIMKSAGCASVLNSASSLRKRNGASCILLLLSTHPSRLLWPSLRFRQSLPSRKNELPRQAKWRRNSQHRSLEVSPYMEKTFHFISGLPRSGSTLLSALLRQNPQIHARVVSPTFDLLHAILPKMSQMSEFNAFFNNGIRKTILRSIVESFYSQTDREIIFDSNRLWTTRLNLLLELFPDAKFICMVRDVNEILNSFEILLARNPLEMTAMFGYSPGASVYSRVEHLMNSQVGVAGLPWIGLREAWFGEHADRLVIIDYDVLVQSPQHVLDMLYARLNLAAYRHDLSDVGYSEPGFDQNLGMPGLHDVRETISKSYNRMLLPPDIIAKHSGHSFWKYPQIGKQSLTLI